MRTSSLLLLSGLLVMSGACASSRQATPPPATTDTAVTAPRESGLPQADALANEDRLDEANAIYRQIASSDASRAQRIAAAIGLYRTGAFADAVQAFQRLGRFAPGEEHLRYYYAVSLYESGRFAAARKELACALPFIELDADVSRYRERIEAMR